MIETKGIVVPPGGGKHLEESPGRVMAMKLFGRDTGQSITLFEQTIPAGAKSWLHLHHDSDEVGWVLEGQFTFKIGKEVTTGGPGTCVFMPRCGMRYSTISTSSMQLYCSNWICIIKRYSSSKTTAGSSYLPYRNNHCCNLCPCRIL